LLVVAIAAPAQARERPALRTYRVSQFLRLDEGQSGSFNVACQHGDLVTDGMWQVDALDSNPQLDDEAFDRVSGVDVLEAESISTTSYRFTLRNNVEGQAQLHLAVTCLAGFVSDGTDRYALRLSAPLTTTAAVPSGAEVTQAVACPAETVAVAPGFRVVTDPGHTARVTASAPLDLALTTLQRRVVAFGDVQTSTSARCLSRNSARRGGRRWRLPLTLRMTPATVAGTDPEAYAVSCRARETAITGMFDLPGAWFVGELPAGRQRTFRVQSREAGADGALHVGLLCLGDRAARPI
jgi:hypothetical protein